MPRMPEKRIHALNPKVAIEHQSTLISPGALAEVEGAFAQYTKLVLESDLSFFSQSEYIDRVDAFLRWLRGEFDPGSRVNAYRKKKPNVAQGELPKEFP